MLRRSITNAEYEINIYMWIHTTVFCFGLIFLSWNKNGGFICNLYFTTKIIMLFLISFCASKATQLFTDYTCLRKEYVFINGIKIHVFMHSGHT